MASSPMHAASHRNVLKYACVSINAALISAPVAPALNENLLNREVFDYDFSRERVFLEIAHAEIEAKKQEDARVRSTSATPSAASTAAENDGVDEELARQGQALSVSDSGRPLSEFRARSPSEEDVAAAISASLREY